MTDFNISSSRKLPEFTRNRVAAICIVLLMAASAFSEKAHAAVDCGSKALRHAAAAACRAHAAAGAVSTQEDGARLTPLSPAAAAPKPLSAAPGASDFSVTSPAAHLNVLARDHEAVVGAGSAELPIDRRPVGGRISDVRSALGDIVQGGGFDSPVVSGPVLWSALLAGLLGLFVMTRGVAAARAQASEAALAPVRRSTVRTSVLDRLDGARYIQSPAQGAPNGCFVRATSSGRFGR